MKELTYRVKGTGIDYTLQEDIQIFKLMYSPENTAKLISDKFDFITERMNRTKASIQYRWYNTLSQYALYAEVILTKCNGNAQPYINTYMKKLSAVKQTIEELQELNSQLHSDRINRIIENLTPRIKIGKYSIPSCFSEDFIYINSILNK